MKSTSRSVLPEQSSSPPSWSEDHVIFSIGRKQCFKQPCILRYLLVVTLNSWRFSGPIDTFYWPGLSVHRLPRAHVSCSRRSPRLKGWFCRGIYQPSLQSTWQQESFAHWIENRKQERFPPAVCFPPFFCHFRQCTLMQVFPRKVILRVDSKCKLSSRMFASNLYGLWCVSPALPHSLIHLYKFCMWSESNRHITRALWKNLRKKIPFVCT